jgi:hypothetical protein
LLLLQKLIKEVQQKRQDTDQKTYFYKIANEFLDNKLSKAQLDVYFEQLCISFYSENDQQDTKEIQKLIKEERSSELAIKLSQENLDKKLKEFQGICSN